MECCEAVQLCSFYQQGNFDKLGGSRKLGWFQVGDWLENQGDF